MRPFLILLIAVALVQVPIVAQGSGCQSHSTVVGSVQPVKTPPPQKLPAKGPQYVLYWLMHHWCPSCQDQAEVIKAFRERYGHEVQVYAVPLSGSTEEVKRFLDREGLSTLPIAREASASFQASTHPILVFRKAGNAYYRINGIVEGGIENTTDHGVPLETKEGVPVTLGLHAALARLSGNLPPSGLKGVTRPLKAQDVDIRLLPEKCIHET